MRPALSSIRAQIALALLVLTLNSCGGSWARRNATAPAPPTSPPPAVPLAADDASSANAIRFLEERVKRDPDDFVALNKLCGYYLQRQREAGDVQYLDLAVRAARASLQA